jgi:16S rRNA (adenine1518-N6/adenine1519-N6)-dimethyltransferase
MKIAPKKSLSQNFLTDKSIAEKIVRFGDFDPSDTIVEIGPGTGALTEYLVKTCARLILVEIDNRAVEVLKTRYSQFKDDRLIIIHSDFLKYDFEKLATEIKASSNPIPNTQYPNITDPKVETKYTVAPLPSSTGSDARLKVIGNIPYGLSGKILLKLTESALFIDKAILTVQKEVAHRIIAQPGNKDYGILTCAVALTGKAKILMNISPGSFFPVPKVDSSVVEIDFFKDQLSETDLKGKMAFIKSAFSQRRKKLGNSLKSYIDLITGLSLTSIRETDEWLSKMLDRRAEELTIEELMNIKDRIKK